MFPFPKRVTSWGNEPLPGEVQESKVQGLWNSHSSSLELRNGNWLTDHEVSLWHIMVRNGMMAICISMIWMDGHHHIYRVYMHFSSVDILASACEMHWSPEVSSSILPTTVSGSKEHTSLSSDGSHLSIMDFSSFSWKGFGRLFVLHMICKPRK